MAFLNKLALVLLIIGGLNWGSIALFSFNFVTWLSFGMPIIESIIYLLVAVSAVWCITLLFRDDEEISDTHSHSHA